MATYIRRKIGYILRFGAAEAQSMADVQLRFPSIPYFDAVSGLKPIHVLNKAMGAPFVVPQGLLQAPVVGARSNIFSARRCGFPKASEECLLSSMSSHF